jgi:hypothetical protein
LVAILVESRDHRTQFWKGAIQGPFHQSLVAIGSVVSEEKIFLKFFFDNNFLFFVTVDSRRSSIKILKEDHICILSIWFDCIWLFTGFQNNFLMNFFTNFLFIVTMVAMFDGGWGPQPYFWKNITYVSNLIAIYSKGFFWIF